MKERIYTIPIQDAFEKKEGCPVCALAEQLESRWVAYITGPAMMEPDVRQETNRAGFCGGHLEAMIQMKNRLSVALLLQTRLDTVIGRLEENQKRISRFGRKGSESEPASCFVCEKVAGDLERISGNIFTVWSQNPEFQRLLSQQSYLCLPHYQLLRHTAVEKRGVTGAGYREALQALVRRGLESVKQDIDCFCNSFDYRSNKANSDPSAATSIERAAEILCGRDYRGKDQ